MKAPDTRHSSMGDEAADWLVRRNAGFTPAEAVDFQRWISADLRHAQVFSELEATWRILNQPRAGGRADELGQILNERAQSRSRRRNIWAVTALAAAAIALAFLPFSFPTSSTHGSPTVAMRPDREVLPDGSVVELNAGAEIAVEYSTERRGVRLVRGEALFAVAKDAAHPFVVIAGGVEVRAVGTAFSVRNDAKQIDVLVTEGRVAVERVGVVANSKTEAEASTGPVYLGAGGRLAVPVDTSTNAPLQATSVTSAQIATALAWRERRVEFTGTTLADAVDLFNRQNRTKLSIADPAVAQLQISGIFWSDDPDGFVRLLESGMNIRAERSPDAIMLRRQ